MKKNLAVATLAVAMMTMTGVNAIAARRTTQTNAVQNTNVKITQSRAESIALSQVKGGQVREIKLKNRRGIPVYEVEVLKDNMEHEFRIDANTGNILSSKSEMEDPDELRSDTSIRNANTKVTLDQAKRIALTNAGGGTVRDYKLERKTNGYVFEIDVIKDNAKYEYKIDAETGNIISSNMKTIR